MSIVSSPRPAVKPTRKPRVRRHHERSVKILLPALPGLAPLVIRITQDGKADTYSVTPLTTDFGLGYRLDKDATDTTPAETYDVLLEIEGDTCTCKGHTYGGYCKHVDCLRELHTRGLLPLPIVANVPDEDDLGERCGSQFDPEIPDAPF